MYITGQTAIVDTEKILNDIGCLDFAINNFKDYIGIYDNVTKEKCFLLKVRISPPSFWKGTTYVDLAWTDSNEKAEDIRNEILKAFNNGAKNIIIYENGNTEVRN